MTTESKCRVYWNLRALEPVLHKREATALRTQALQLEKRHPAVKTLHGQN